MTHGLHGKCLQCGDVNKLRRRDFSEQAWSALVVWGEIEKSMVNQPVCDTCYGDLRDVLIERADEFELSTSVQIQKSKSKGRGKAAA